MKKLLTIAALAATASLSFGQGYVSFANTSGTRVSTNSLPSSTGGAAPAVLAGSVNGTPSYYYALMAAPTTQTTVDATLTGWSFSGSYGTNQGSGRIFGANNPDGIGTIVNGFGPTATANFVVVGWSINIGSTLAQALAWWNNGQPTSGPAGGGNVGYFGISGVALNIPLAPSGGPYNSMFGGSPSITGMVLGAYTVPEPSTFALAGLGAAALLIFRRRK